MNSTLCCNSEPNPPLSFFLSVFLTLSTPLSTHTHTHINPPSPLPPSLPLSSRPLGFWSSGVRWVGGLVGGRWGCRAERAGIQSNMLGEITIAPLGDLQMLAVRGIVVGSYHSSSISWETAKQHIQPTDPLSLSFFLRRSPSPSTPNLPFSAFWEILAPGPHMYGNTEKGSFSNTRYAISCYFLL